MKDITEQELLRESYRYMVGFFIIGSALTLSGVGLLYSYPDFGLSAPIVFIFMGTFGNLMGAITLYLIQVSKQQKVGLS